MEAFEKELNKLVGYDLADFDAKFAQVYAELRKHLGGDKIPGDCASFDWYVGDTASELHRITSTRRIYLNLIEALSSIVRAGCPLEVTGSLVEFSLAWRGDSRFSVPTVYTKRDSDKAIAETAYRMAAGRVNQALYAEKFDQEDL